MGSSTSGKGTQPLLGAEPRWYHDKRTVAAVGLASALRIALFSTPLAGIAESRPELSTPVTGWRELQECAWMLEHGYDPYDGGVCYHSPILVSLFASLPSLDSPLVSVLWIAADVCSAILLSEVWRLKQTQYPTTSVKGHAVWGWENWQVVALYLFSPFTVLSTLAKSTINFSNALILASLVGSLRGRLLFATGCLSLATQLGMYPALLMPLCALLLHRARPQADLTVTVASAVGSYLAHLVLSRYLLVPSFASTADLASVYGTLLTIPDLSPNIGLHWYFNIEMFDHFRSFFGWVLGAVGLGGLVWVAPLGIKYRKQPLFAVALMTGIVATFKTYPSVGDWALATGLYSLFPEAIAHMRHPLLTASLLLYSACLLPTFHLLWLSPTLNGAGNANFYYAATVVFAVCGGAGTVDLCWGMGVRRVLEEERGERSGSGKAGLEEGEVVMQA